MNKLSLFFLVCFFSSSMMSHQLIAANLPVDPALEAYSEAVDGLVHLQTELKTAGSAPVGCANCEKPIEPDLKIVLAKEVSLGSPSIYKDNVPFIIHLKRTKETPEKVVLKFKNGHSECAQMYIGSNPFYPGGPLVAGCLYRHTVYEDEEIEINFKKYPWPKNNAEAGGDADEEQILELKITKADASRGFYGVDLQTLKGPPSVIHSKGKKFWHNGYNLGLATAEALPVTSEASP